MDVWMDGWMDGWRCVCKHARDDISNGIVVDMLKPERKSLR